MQNLCSFSPKYTRVNRSGCLGWRISFKWGQCSAVSWCKRQARRIVSRFQLGPKWGKKSWIRSLCSTSQLKFSHIALSIQRWTCQVCRKLCYISILFNSLFCIFILSQRPKKSKLSGWQTLARKNFPDGARKSFLLQMRQKARKSFSRHIHQYVFATTMYQK